MRILLVEDELKIARAVRRGLEQEGYAVDAVADGGDALRRALFEDYDAIVLDVMLPGLDGFAICRELRTKGRWAPVLMLTARDGVDDRIRGLDAGADDYLVKPFSFGSSCSPASADAPRWRRAPSRARDRDVVLDPATHTVDRPILGSSSSAREFALLEFLMRHSGEVVSRSRILEHVWDVNYAGFSNVVDVYIGYLRKKARGPVRPARHPHRARRRLRGGPDVSLPDPGSPDALVRRASCPWSLLVLSVFLTLRLTPASSAVWTRPWRPARRRSPWVFRTAARASSRT